MKLDYPALLDLFPQHRDKDRSESASFLIWYLENYYRLDPIDAIDAVCDQGGDKGVDGIYVNDNDQTITVFQSKISQRSNTTIGDAPLRDFSGTLTQFETAEALENLVSSAGSAQVAALIKRLDLTSKLRTHEVRGEFVVNLDLDRNGESYLKSATNIAFVGKSHLAANFISDTRGLPIQSPASFDLFGFSVTEYIVDAERKAIIAPVKAAELVALSGISDQSIFSYNVRGPLGRTKVNKDIVTSIRDRTRHKLFPLFHNGITIIAGKVTRGDNKIEIDNYYVVNGCQSLTALYNNSASITDDLRLLVRIVALDPASSEAGIITTYSNNQNGVKPRDSKSNSPTQIRLRNEFAQLYKGTYALEIKQGEYPGEGEVISNEDAGLYLLAFDKHEPWSAHQRYSVFEDKHADLFGRPHITADFIVMCRVVADSITALLPNMENSLFAKYALTKYMVMHIVRQILEKDDLADELFSHPAQFVRDAADRARFRKCIDTIVADIIVDLNDELTALDDKAAYRDNLKTASWVRRLAGSVVSDHQKFLARKKVKSFAEEWSELKVGTA